MCMTSRELQEGFDRARIAAERRGTALVLDLGIPASQADIDACEKVIGAKLTIQLRSFLERWNGMTIKCYPVGWPVTAEGWTDRFDVASTEMIARLTSGITDFFKMGAEACPIPDDASRRIAGLLVLSCQDDLVVYHALDRCDGHGDCPIMKFNLEYSPDWFEDPGVPIASSVEEFVTRSLQHMASAGDNFLYWL